MKKRLSGILIGVVFIGVANLASGATPIDRIVATVNGEIITQSDLLKTAAPLTALIEEKIILQSAEKEGVKISELELERGLQEMERQNQFEDREAFRQAVITSSGLSWENYLSRLKVEMTTMKLMGRQLQDLFVTEEEIKAAYRRDPKAFQSDKVALRQILFPVSPEMPEASISAVEKTANKIALEITGETDFEKFRTNDSFIESGAAVSDLGYFNRDDLATEIAQLVFILEIGETSAVIKTPTGFHFFQVTNKSTAVLSEDTTRTKISEHLLREKREAFNQEWMRQIKREAVIEIK
ncbi:MAG: peptidyl-prolyl cis-trans isomerase [Nitrospirota bacterium]